MKTVYFTISFFLLIFITNCSEDNSTNPHENNKLKVAVLIDLSGFHSQFGIEMQQAIDLTLPKTKNIEIEYFDSKVDVTIASNQLDSIIKKGDTKVVVTLGSWVSNGLANKIKDNNMLQVAVGSAAFDYASLNSCIRFTGDVSIESNFLTEQLVKFDKIAVLYFNNDLGKGWFNTLTEKLGAKIVASKQYELTQTDFSAELQELNKAKPEIIVLISTKEAVTIVKQAQSLGIIAQMIGTRTALTKQLLEEPAAEGLIFSYPDLNEDLPVYQEFFNKYNYKMSAFGAEGYDLIITLENAYQNSNNDRDVLFNNIKNKTYSGALGEITFSEHCQASYNYCFMKIKNKTFIKY